jgi:hypothetical protein
MFELKGFPALALSSSLIDTQVALQITITAIAKEERPRTNQ